MLLNSLSSIAAAVGSLTSIFAAIKWVVLPVRRYFAKLDAIYQQVMPNGGSSIADRINRVKETVAKIENRQRAWLTVHNEPVFEMSGAGDCNWANRAFLHLLGVSFDEVEGRGWRNFLVGDEIYKKWKAAVADKRDFKACFSFRNSSGEEIPVCLEALAMKDEKGGLLGYVGNVEKKHSR